MRRRPSAPPDGVTAISTAGRRVALVVPFHDAAAPAPGDLIARQATLPGLIGALDRRGLVARGFQLYPVDAAVQVAGGQVEFVAPPRGTRRIAALTHRIWGRHGPAYWEPASRLLGRVAAFRPDVVHTFGLGLEPNMLLTSRLCRRLGVPLVLSYHGGPPPRDRLSRRALRSVLTTAAAVLFTAREQSLPWIDAGLITSPGKVFQVFETSTPLTAVDRPRARAQLNLFGDPACVMAGRMHPVKDPLTTLTGFLLAAEHLPDARLYVYPLAGPLSEAFSAVVAAIPLAATVVSVRPAAAPEDMATVFSAADYLVQSSRREWSGLTVMEAMACGAIPVVTDLPPLVRMTDFGRAGRHFTPGHPRGLAQALQGAEAAGRGGLRRHAQDRFIAALSFDALARDLEAVYRAVAPGEASPGPRGTGAS